MHEGQDLDQPAIIINSVVDQVAPEAQLSNLEAVPLRCDPIGRISSGHLAQAVDCVKQPAIPALYYLAADTL